MQFDEQCLPLTVGRQAQYEAACAGLDNTVNVQHTLGVDGPAADEVIVAQRSGYDDDFVFLQEVAEFLERLTEEADFHPTGVIVEYHADAIAALAHVNDQAGNSCLTTRGVVALALVGLGRRFRNYLAQFAVRKITRIVPYRIEWMSCQVQAQRFILIAQEETFLPLLKLDRGVLRLHVCDRLAEAEHVILTSRCSLGLLVCATQGLRDLVHQAASCFTKAIHRA